MVAKIARNGFFKIGTDFLQSKNLKCLHIPEFQICENNTWKDNLTNQFLKSFEKENLYSINDENVIFKLVIVSHKTNIIFIDNASFIKSLYLHRF